MFIFSRKCFSGAENTFFQGENNTLFEAENCKKCYS